MVSDSFRPCRSVAREAAIEHRHRRLAGSVVPRALHRAPGRWCMLLLLSLLLALGGCGGQPPKETLRVGVLTYGSVNWELATVRAHDLAAKRGVNLEVVPLASENALAVALQAGRVDVIVSDWLWVARQRAKGRMFQFAPYSMAVGSVMVNPEAGIDSVAELAGHKMGIAGGPVGKTWLLLRAYARRKYGLDLQQAVQEKYASPPIINKLMLSGDLPAAINYWHYNARLRAKGMETLITLDKMLAAFGVSAAPPLLGWVFKQEWANRHADTLKAFLEATYAAKEILATSREAWEALRERIKPETEAVFEAIIAGYREGIPREYGREQIQAARELYRIIVQEAGKALARMPERLPDELFWDGFRLQ